MQSIVSVRRALDQFVPGAFIDFPWSEIAQAGDYPATTVWNAEESPFVELDVPSGAENDLGRGPDAPQFEFAAEAEVDVKRLLGSGLGNHIAQAAKQRGVDALAWYVSFHARGAQWGIYLPITSIVGMATTVFRTVPMNLADRMRLSAHVMHQHELFHFAVDHMTALHELAQQRPCWLPGRSLRSVRGYYELEEKLANAYMLRRINAVKREAIAKGRSEALRKFVADQPDGYRDAPHAFDGPVFRAECKRLCLAYFEKANGRRVPEEVFGLLGPELLGMERLDWRYCPVHIVHDENRFSLPQFTASLFVNVSAIFEPEGFLKQLHSCDQRIQRAWARVKQKLAQTVRLVGLDFKQWRRRADGVEYSVRVEDNFRAHLLFSPAAQSWTALAIGTHKQMGHG